MNDTSAAHGGESDINPKQDVGFLYSRNLAYPGGDVWEGVWMDSAGG